VVHLFTDLENGFAGISSELLTYVAEECPRTPVVTFGSLLHVAAATKEEEAKRALSTLLSLDAFTSRGPLVPMDPSAFLAHPGAVSLDQSLLYHATAPGAVLAELLTTPGRLRVDTTGAHGTSGERTERDEGGATHDAVSFWRSVAPTRAQSVLATRLHFPLRVDEAEASADGRVRPDRAAAVLKRITEGLGGASMFPVRAKAEDAPPRSCAAVVRGVVEPRGAEEALRAGLTTRLPTLAPSHCVATCSRLPIPVPVTFPRCWSTQLLSRRGISLAHEEGAEEAGEAGVTAGSLPPARHVLTFPAAATITSGGGAVGRWLQRIAGSIRQPAASRVLFEFEKCGCTREELMEAVDMVMAWAGDDIGC